MPPREHPSRKKAGSKSQRRPRLSHTRKPDHLSLEEWQIELRRQFGREQKFKLVNQGEDPAFSVFAVTNPASGNTYKVEVRGRAPGDNRCSCPDFATNTLGTCKHIEFTLSRLERTRDTRARLKEGFHPPTSEVYLQYGAAREVRFRPGTECPVELARLAAATFDEAGALRPEAVSTFETFLTEATRLEPELRCDNDALAYLAELRDAERRRELVKNAFPRGARSAAFKDLLKVSLYDYQRDGALFAARSGRTLLGDEMGLGKTVQAIATAEIMARLFGVERVLVVCPTSLKHQWEREIERMCDRSALVVGGLRGPRLAAFADPAPFFKITNYDTVHADLDLIEGWAPDLVILDEAQRIKNWTTRVARSVKKISSPYALVLTGTPLENRLEELVSIVQFVDMYRLGPTFRLLHTHQIRDDVGKVVGYRELDKLGQTLAPILLRRQKEQVLSQLPGRIDSNVFVPMTTQQMQDHHAGAEVVARIVAKWRKYGFLTEADQRRLMAGLQMMRMSCDSTYLLDQQTDFGQKADEATTLLDELFERPGTKVVVFSQWLGMHEVLLRRVRGKRWGHVMFHGSVPSHKRRELVDKFREDPECRLFLSTDAGGVGLNLQHASVVLNMDLPWNPAVLEQRIGRVHRLGQQQPVRVVNFVARGTIEEGMLNVLKFKKSLFAGVLDGGEKEVFLGGSRLTRFMETVEAATAAIPAGTAEEPQDVPAEPEPPPAPTSGTGAPAAAPAPTGDGDEATAPPAGPDPWSGLLQAGMALIQQFAGGTVDGAVRNGTPRVEAFVQRDSQTGEPYLRLPVPPPQVIDQAVRALSALLESFRK
jgi:superfamily II DNA or RNA helicase